MLFNVHRKFLYIHIPRCAGTSMTKALQLACPLSFVEELGWKHAHAKQIKTFLIKNQWDVYYKFATIRSPWEIIESDWRHVHRLVNDPPPPAEMLIGQWWLKRVDRVMSYANFQEFVEKEYIIESPIQLVGYGGFWNSFCCDDYDQEMDINPILYSDLPGAWDAICDEIRIPKSEFPNLNHSEAEPGIWTQSLIDNVGNQCYKDIEKFGFKPPII